MVWREHNFKITFGVILLENLKLNYAEVFEFPRKSPLYFCEDRKGNTLPVLIFCAEKRRLGKWKSTFCESEFNYLFIFSPRKGLSFSILIQYVFSLKML